MQERRHQRTHDLRETDGTRGQTFAIRADQSQFRVLNIRIRVASPCCALESDWSEWGRWSRWLTDRSWSGSLNAQNECTWEETDNQWNTVNQTSNRGVLIWGPGTTGGLKGGFREEGCEKAKGFFFFFYMNIDVNNKTPIIITKYISYRICHYCSFILI